MHYADRLNFEAFEGTRVCTTKLIYLERNQSCILPQAPAGNVGDDW